MRRSVASSSLSFLPSEVIFLTPFLSFPPFLIQVKVLRCVPPIAQKDTLLGQYTAAGGKPGYLEDDTVPKGSNCPTFAETVLFINNPRWEGVPFIMKAGKGEFHLLSFRVRSWKRTREGGREGRERKGAFWVELELGSWKADFPFFLSFFPLFDSFFLSS